MIGRNLAEIGRGGNGFVYRAHDLNLSRGVALNILPEDGGECSRHVPPLAFAWITSKLIERPERDVTAEWVEKAFAERSPLLTFWSLPVCDGLRADARFANVRERMNAV